MAAKGSKAERETEEYSPATSSFVSSLMALRCSNRHSRVCVGNILDYLGNTITKHETNSKRSFLLSGSNGEGVVISNDIDYMLVDGQIEVSTEYHGTSDSLKHCLTTLCTEHTHAGYATLVVNNPDVFPHKECIDIIDGKPCLASALYVQKALKQVTDVSDAEGYHGPAVIRARASELHVPSDYVYTLSCPVWPARTRQRFEQQNCQKWPPEHLLSQLEQNGCHYVPTGYPGSPKKDAEWRLSFSCAEKVFIKCLNSTQYYCFNFLKMMGRANLRSNTEPKVICTYYFKTALFWTIEKELGEVWVESRFLTCLHLILGRLISFMRNHNLPNYFIPENNMIDHIPYDRCSKVAEELESIRNELLYRVFSIVTLGVPLKEECRVFVEILPLGDREHDFANEKDRENFNKNLVDTLGSLDSTEQDELMRRATSVISNKSDIFRDKKRKDVRNDLQNFLDPQLFDFLPGVHESQVLKQALLSAIDNIASLTKRSNYASCYEKVLYRTLGNICHIQSLVISKAESEAKACKLNEEAELYYCKGKSLVFPDGFDDQTLSGHVLLAQFHYMNGKSNEAAGEIKKIESMIDDEKLARRISEYCVCTEICNPLHLEVLKHDQGLYDYFRQLPPRSSKFINSVALAHYLRIKTLVEEAGQTEGDRVRVLFVNKFRKFCESFGQQRQFSLIDKIVSESAEVLLQIIDEDI